METVLLIFTVLLIEFVYEPIAILRNDQNIKKFYIIFNTFFKEFFEKKFLIYMSFVLFSVLEVIVIEAFLATFIHWSLSFIFSFIILIYCLRPNEFNEKIDDLKFIIKNKAKIEDDTLIKLLAVNIKVGSLSQKMFYAFALNLFFSSTRNIFTVIFWFLLIGPGGALGYKILDYFVFTKDLRIDQKSRNNIKDILALIEFIPIRLSSLAFAMVGNFEHAFKSWKEFDSNKRDLYQSNVELINSIGSSSAQLIPNCNEEDILEKISYIQTLVGRSLLAWLSIIMLLIFGGFFS